MSQSLAVHNFEIQVNYNRSNANVISITYFKESMHIFDLLLRIC